MKKLINDKFKVIILSSGCKASNVGIYEDTGELVFNKPSEDIPRGLPVDLFIINPHSNKLSEGDIFVLTDSYDELHYCTNIDGDSVSAGVLQFNNRDYEIKRPIFTQHPIKNVHKVIGTSKQDITLKLWIMDEDLIKEIINQYNTNSKDKMFQPLI